MSLPQSLLDLLAKMKEEYKKTKNNPEFHPKQPAQPQPQPPAKHYVCANEEIKTEEECPPQIYQNNSSNNMLVEQKDYCFHDRSVYNLYFICSGYMRNEFELLGFGTVDFISNIVFNMVIPSNITINKCISTPYNCMLYLSNNPTNSISYGFQDNKKRSSWSLSMFIPPIMPGIITQINVERIVDTDIESTDTVNNNYKIDDITILNRYHDIDGPKSKQKKPHNTICNWGIYKDYRYQCGLIGILKENNSFSNNLLINKNFKVPDKLYDDFSNVKNASFKNINWIKSNGVNLFNNTDKYYIEFSKDTYQLGINKYNRKSRYTYGDKDLTIYISIRVDNNNNLMFLLGKQNENRVCIDRDINGKKFWLEFSKYVYYFCLSSQQCWCDCDPFEQFKISMNQIKLLK